MSKTPRLICRLLIPFSLLVFFSCSKNPNQDVAGIDLDLDLVRVDSMMWAYAQAFQQDSNLDIYEAFDTYLGSERDFFYNYLGMSEVIRVRRLSPALGDSIMKAQIASLLKEQAMWQLLDSIQDVFSSQAQIESQLLPPLKRLVKYFPEIQMPAFRTFVNGYVPGADMNMVDQVVSIPGYMGLGLHYFMGKNFPYYPENIPGYQRRYYENDHLDLAMVNEISKEIVRPLPRNQSPSLLDGMVRAGIKQYFLQQLLPNSPDSVRLRYDSRQMFWAETYEARIYKELIDKFFDSNFKLQREYLGEKPYTSTLSTESAPRIGEYCGWKIVQSYMKRNPDVSLAELCDMNDYEKILRESKYKPSN